MVPTPKRRQDWLMLLFGIAIIVLGMVTVVQTRTAGHRASQLDRKTSRLEADRKRLESTVNRVAAALTAEQENQRLHDVAPVAPAASQLVKGVPSPAAASGADQERITDEVLTRVLKVLPPGSTGPPGPTGPTGSPGPAPPCLQTASQCQGEPGTNGQDGKDGAEGAAGRPPSGMSFTVNGTTFNCTPDTPPDPGTSPHYTCTEAPPAPPTPTATPGAAAPQQQAATPGATPTSPLAGVVPPTAPSARPCLTLTCLLLGSAGWTGL